VSLSSSEQMKTICWVAIDSFGFNDFQ